MRTLEKRWADKRRTIKCPWIIGVFLFTAVFPGTAGAQDSASGGGPPKINLIGIPDGVRRHIEEAWTAADKNPNDAGKLGKLAMRYFVPAPLVSAECFAKASSLSPESAKWCYFEGLAYSAAYRRSDALKAFERAAQLDPKYAPIFCAWGDALLSTDAKAAAEKYRQAVSADSKLARAHCGLGRAIANSGEKDNAVRHLNEAVQLAPQYAAAHEALAEIYNSREQFKDARVHEVLSKSGTAPPPGNDPWLFDLFSECSSGTELLEFSEGLAGENRLDEAIGLLEQATARNGEDVTLLHALAVLLDKAGRHREAVVHFRTVLELAPAQLETVLYLGQALTHSDDFISAASLIKEVVQEEPENLDALRLYSGLMLRLRRPEDAEPFLEKAAKLHPSDGSIQLALAMSAVCLDRIGSAIEHFKRAKTGEAAAGDTARMLLSNLAQTFVDQRKSAAAVFAGLPPVPASRLGLIAEAMDSEDMSGDADVLKNYPDYFVKRAGYLARQGSYDEAVLFLTTGAGHPEARLDSDVMKRFRQLADANTGDLTINHVLARCLAAMGESSAAIERWERIIKSDPEFEPAAITMASVCMQSGDFNRAESVLRDFMNRRADSLAVANALAWCLATCPSGDEKKRKEAVQIAERVCKADPESEPSYWDTLATAHAVAGDFTRAVDCENRALKLATEKQKASGVEGFKRRLKMFELKVPYREEPTPAAK